MKNRIIISNRGPDFTVGKKAHHAMGGTKGLYPQIFEAMCDKWVCLASDAIAGDVSSDYGSALNVLFIRDSMYFDYYYRYVSEYLYPSLLGYKQKAEKTGKDGFDETIRKLSEKAIQLGEENDYVICDYHLYDIPRLLPKKSKKTFFWFIPFLTIDKYKPDFREVLLGLNEADKLYVFDDVWAQNFVNLFRHFCPHEDMKVEVSSLMMGPDDFYEQEFDADNAILESIFKKNFQGKIIASVSRMDFVKEIPLLIQGFNKLMDESYDENCSLLIFAPHHRKDSRVYASEHKKIIQLAKESKYAQNIHITHEHFSSFKLRKIYNAIDIFVCPSIFDAMPLTPLEFMMSSKQDATVLISDSLGSYRLLRGICYSFKAGDITSLAKNLNLAFKSDPLEKARKNRLIKDMLSYSTIQKAIKVLKINEQ